ncbi:hypothetical protein TSAR_015821 [Trichomalopsis sarcophagae]|uniref:BEN domain-containing protein n=1 Tax=Trichomalopsis sarcophagae TaxID=543379 RepID=A0A232EKX2_9HYME|nr:hypothetical protein TSAR_015821 [Trichomalopsis sarcophagae]
MYAYVKFIDGANQGHKKIVKAESINHKFNEDLKFNSRGTYTITYDGSEQRAQIIFLKRTQNEINKLVQSNKRIKSKLDQDNNVSKSDQNDLQKSITFDEGTMKSITFDEGTMVNKRQEVDDLTMAQDSQISIAKNAADQSTDGKNNKVTAKDDVLKKTSNNSRLKSGNNGDVMLSEAIKQKLDTAVIDESYPTEEATDNIKNKPNIKSVEPVHMHFACKRKQQEFLKTIKEKEEKIQKLKDENEKKQKQLHDLKKENTRLKNKNNGLIDEREKANKIALTKETLIEQLQRVIIEKFFEHNTIKDQLKDFEKDLEIDDTKNYLPVGSHRQSDNTIHIGRNQRLSAGIYSTVMRSKKPSACVAHALLAVFGESTLLRSTLTGNISNRTKGIMKGKTGKRGKKGKADKKEKDAEDEDNVSEVEDDPQIETNKENKNEIIPKYEKLDGVKLAACEDLFIHYVRTIYGKKKGVTDANIQVELSSFNEYVSRQISYLKRERGKKKIVEKDVDETIFSVEEPDKKTENTYANLIMLEEAASSSMSNSLSLLSTQAMDPLAIEYQEKSAADSKDRALDDTQDVMDDMSSDYSSVHLDDTVKDDSVSDTEDL